MLAIGGGKSFGTNMATVMRNAAVHVHGEVVPDSGHWLMAERPVPTIALIDKFLAVGR